jgi:hypothetical protein
VKNREKRGCGAGAIAVTGLNKGQERFDVERIVIGGAVADLHRLPHGLGDASPRRVDQFTGRRTGDEDPRQVEQKGGVFVSPRVQTLKRHHELAPAKVGIADQVERRVGRDEAASLKGAQQMRSARADDALDLRKRRCCIRTGRRLGPRVPKFDPIQKFGHWRADRSPVRRLVIAGPNERLAQVLQTLRVVQLR